MAANLSHRLHNPVTGDWVEFLASPMLDGGETVLFRCPCHQAHAHRKAELFAFLCSLDSDA